MTIKERPKASELFKKGKIGVLLGRCPFDEAFPMIEDITVEVTQTGKGTYGDDVSHLTKQNLGEFIDCQNPLCEGGGFRIARVIRDMVKERKTEHKTTGLCRKCMNRFNVKVRIKYKPAVFGP